MIHQSDQDDSHSNPFPLFGYFSQFLFIITSILWNFFRRKVTICENYENCETKFKKSDLKNSECSLGRFHFKIFFWIFMNFPAQNFPLFTLISPALIFLTINWVGFVRRFGFGILILPFNRVLSVTTLTTSFLVVRAQFFLTICWNQIDQWAFRISPTPN